MFGAKKKLLEIINPTMDIGLTGAAFILSYFIKKFFLPLHLRGLSIAPNYYIILLMVIITWYSVFKYHGWILPDSRKNLVIAIKNMVKAVSAGMVIIFLCLYIFKITDVSRIMMGIFCILDLAFLSLSKFGLYCFIHRCFTNGKNVRNVLIIGSKERARDFLCRISGDNLANYKVLGCLEVDKSLIGQAVQAGIKVIGSVTQLKDILLKRVVDEIIFAMPLKLVDHPQEYLALAENIGVTVRIVPDWQVYKIPFKPRIAHARFDESAKFPTLLLSTVTPVQSDYLIKYLLDYVIAGISLVVLAPVFSIVALAIKVSSKGPVFFKQERCGLNGRRFMIYKFRTMVEDAEEKLNELKALNEADGPVFKIKKDPRIVHVVGTLLRKTQLDEFPQLINVIRGEMSLVGPRPPIPDEVDNYDIWQRRRLSMKPGLTCLWQIAPKRNEISFEEWMEMDLKYIDDWSLGLDLKIFLKTFNTVFLGGGR